MSNLLKHAECEMRLAGLYDKDSDYGGMIPEAVLKMVKVFADEGHSGCSHALVMSIFNRVANFKTLTPINSDQDTWMKVSDECAHSKACWQSKRDPEYFSEDGGKTFYFLSDPEKKNFPDRFPS